MLSFILDMQRKSLEIQQQSCVKLILPDYILNIIFGGVIGIIGGIIMLNTRTLARGNQFVFQGGHVPQRPVSPYTPQQPVTPPQPPVQQQPPMQQNQNVQTETKQEASVTSEPHEDENTEQNHKSE